ncbi:MAG: DUF1566 domain-containing protein [Nitrospirae bacterium]|nr:DUF1566 domain-containing protein [Nitrospirota bacterium]
MKKRFGRILIAVVAVLICTAYLGCGGGDGESTTTTTTKSASITTTVATTTTSATTSSSTTTTVLVRANGVVPDTGQVKQFTPSYGEDSDYSINLPWYSFYGDEGSVMDIITGLMWQWLDDGMARTWANAGSYCDNLMLQGYTDWRLPTVKELIDIVNYGTYAPAIDSRFMETKSSYWSSTLDSDNSLGAWGMDFYHGSAARSDMLAINGYVRCVRGEASTQQLTANGNGTVSDHAASLVWQQQDDGTPRTWEGAIRYCGELSLDGNIDWRLPNVKELKSIVDYTKRFPSIDITAFPVTHGSGYWSSTSSAYNSSNAWLVDFSHGDVGNDDKTGSNYVRCVRGG